MKLAAAFLAALALVSCGGEDPAAPDAGRAVPSAHADAAIHVHGVGTDPADGSLLVATHTGLFRAPRGKADAVRVGSGRSDLMGFTVAGPRRFLASGHPGAGEDLPPFLGLVSSTDAGATWSEVSLGGQADFHVLEAAGDRVYGFGADFESQAQQFLVSEDGGRSWAEQQVPGALVSLAVSPDDPDRVVAAATGGPGPDGLHTSPDAGRRWQPLGGDPGLVAWARDGTLHLVGASGQVSSSDDGGRSWAAVGELGGQPTAFEASGPELLAALDDGTVKHSEDGGRTWSVRARVDTAPGG